MKFLLIADGTIPVMDSWYSTPWRGEQKYIMQIDEKYEKNIWKHFSCKHYWIKHFADGAFLLIRCLKGEASEWDHEEFKEKSGPYENYENKFKKNKVFEAYYV
jgi:hypothetical protein